MLFYDPTNNKIAFKPFYISATENERCGSLERLGATTARVSVPFGVGITEARRCAKDYCLQHTEF